MENRRAVLFSVAAAGIAMLSFFYYLHLAVNREIGDLKRRVVVIKARVDIQANTRITEDMLLQAEYPESFLPPKAAFSMDEVINQVALATIFEGEPILTSKLVPFDESSIDRRIPDGYRAITVGIRDDQDVVGVGGLLRPGHFVDILVTLFINTREIEKGSMAALGADQAANLKAETRTVFQNIKILAVGRDARIAPAQVNRPQPMEEELTNKNVTVALRPDDVQKLVLAQSVGRLTLSLRKFNDADIAQLDYLDAFKAFGVKLPVVMGPPPAYREIRGGQVFSQPF